MSNCVKADVNPLARDCPYRRRCKDSRCLKSKLGKQFVIEPAKCCCPVKEPCPRAFTVSGQGVVAEDSQIGTPGETVIFFFGYDASDFSVVGSTSDSKTYESNIPIPTTVIVGGSPIQSQPMYGVKATNEGIGGDSWDYLQNTGGFIPVLPSLLYNNSDGTAFSSLPDDFCEINKLFVEQFNATDKWNLSFGSASFYNTDSQLLRVESVNTAIAPST